jgi:hypothetical protein
LRVWPSIKKRKEKTNAAKINKGRTHSYFIRPLFWGEFFLSDAGTSFRSRLPRNSRGASLIQDGRACWRGGGSSFIEDHSRIIGLKQTKCTTVHAECDQLIKQKWDASAAPSRLGTTSRLEFGRIGKRSRLVVIVICVRRFPAADCNTMNEK